MNDEDIQYSRDLSIRQHPGVVLLRSAGQTYLINPFSLSYCAVNQDMEVIWAYVKQPRILHNLFERFQLHDTFDEIIKELAKKGLVVLSDPRSSARDPTCIEFPMTDRSHLAIFPTHNCNLRCIYCYGHGGEEKTVIDKSYVDALMDYFFETHLNKKAKSAGLDFHGGGEPTVAFDVMQYATERFIQQCKRRGLSYTFGMATNGCFGDTVFEWLVRNRFDLTISFDGPPDIQNYQRPFRNGSESHDVVKNNILRFVERGIQFGVRSTITADVVSCLCEIVQYISSLGVKFIHLEPCSEVGRCMLTGTKQPHLRNFLDNFMQAFPLAVQSGVHLMISSLRATEYPHNRFCGACGSNLAITPEGYLTTCYEVVRPADPDSEHFFVGQVSKRKDKLVTVKINQEKLGSIAARTVENIRGCSDCFAKYWCAGDCPVKAYRDTGSLYQISPERCSVIKEINEKIVRMVLDEEYLPSSQVSIIKYEGGGHNEV